MGNRTNLLMRFKDNGTTSIHDNPMLRIMVGELIMCDKCNRTKTFTYRWKAIKAEQGYFLQCSKCNVRELKARQ